MAKKKRAKSGGAAAAAAAAAAKRKSGHPAVRTVLPAVLGAIGFVLLFGYTSLLPLVVVPLIVGAFVGLTTETELRAGVSGAVAGTLGAAASIAFFQLDAFTGYVRNLPPASIRDVTGSFWQDFMLPLIQSNPVNAPAAGSLFTLLGGMVFTAGVAFGIHRLAAGLKDERAKLALRYAVVGLLAISFIYTATGNSTRFVSDIRDEPQTGQYSYDGIIDLKTVYLMRGGMNYYDSLVRAVGGDARIIEEKGVVDNKYQGSWGASPSRQREPAVFYVWAALGLRDMAGVFWGAIALCVGILFVSYWVLSKWLSDRALFVPIFAAPALLVPIVWYNLFQPDLWAALVLILSALFLLRGDTLVAIALGLVAALFREVFVVWLFVLLAVYGVALIRERSRARVLAAVGCALAILVFTGAYAAHYVKAGEYLAVRQTEQTSLQVGSNAARPLSEKFIGPTAFMMVPYGAGTIPPWPMIVLGAAGVLGLAAAGRYRRYAVAAYLLFWLVFYATIGSTSSYWGQDVMPLAVMGTAILMADAENWVERIARLTRGSGKAA